MKAMYYLGQSIGKTRKDQRPFYVVNILCLDRFGNISCSPLYVTEQEYAEVLDLALEPGDAVRVSVTFNGVFQGIEPDTRFVPLEFDKKANNPVPPAQHTK